jgi:serine/threonine-protein kinase
VIATLPKSARRRVPLRMRIRGRWAIAGLVLSAAVVAAVLVLVGNQAADRVQRGTGVGREPAPAGNRTISVPRGSAKDYDPDGDGVEHPEWAARAVDGDPASAWRTENYMDNVLAGTAGPKDGVGLYVDARPEVEATSMLIQTPEPGWEATIYGAPKGEVPETIDEGWTEVGGGTVEKGKQRFTLDTAGTPYRYYLIWITALPPDASAVEIADVSLTQKA